MKRFIYLCTFLCALLLSVMPVKAQKTQKSSTVTVEGIVVDENNVPMKMVNSICYLIRRMYW